MKYIKLLLVLIFIIFEEVIWNRIGEPIYLAIKSLNIMLRFRTWVAEFKNRYALLLIFLTPFIIMEIIGLLSLKAFATGAIILGITLYILKVLLTVPVVIIYKSAEQELRSFSLIDFGHTIIMKIRESELFLSVKASLAKFKEEIRQIKIQYLSSGSEWRNIYTAIKSIITRTN